MSDIKIFNTNPFDFILIKPGKISHLDWNNPDYVQILTSMPFITTHLTKPDEFFDNIIINIFQISNKLIHFALLITSTF